MTDANLIDKTLEEMFAMTMADGTTFRREAEPELREKLEAMSPQELYNFRESLQSVKRKPGRPAMFHGEEALQMVVLAPHCERTHQNMLYQFFAMKVLREYADFDVSYLMPDKEDRRERGYRKSVLVELGRLFHYTTDPDNMPKDHPAVPFVLAIAGGLCEGKSGSSKQDAATVRNIRLGKDTKGDRPGLAMALWHALQTYRLTHEIETDDIVEAVYTLERLVSDLIVKEDLAEARRKKRRKKKRKRADD